MPTSTHTTIIAKTSALHRSTDRHAACVHACDVQQLTLYWIIPECHGIHWMWPLTADISPLNAGKYCHHYFDTVWFRYEQLALHMSAFSVVMGTLC